MAYTALPDWVVDQLVAYSELNALYANDAASWDLFNEEHVQHTAEHRGFLFPEAMGRAIAVTEERIDLAGTSLAVVNGGSTVVGTGTAFLTEMSEQDQIIVQGEVHYVVHVIDDTNIRVAGFWALATGGYSDFYGERAADPYYYWTPMSYGWVGEPLREQQGVVRCPLRWRVPQGNDGSDYGWARSVQVGYDNVVENTREEDPEDHWRVATCETLGNITIGEWSDEDSVLVKLQYEQPFANYLPQLRDSSFDIVVWQNFNAPTSP